MDPRHGELDLEDLALEWVSHMSGNSSQDHEELLSSMEALHSSYHDATTTTTTTNNSYLHSCMEEYLPQINISCGHQPKLVYNPPNFLVNDDLPLDNYSYDHFLNDSYNTLPTSPSSPNFSGGDPEYSSKSGGDLAASPPSLGGDFGPLLPTIDLDDVLFVANSNDVLVHNAEEIQEEIQSCHLQYPINEVVRSKKRSNKRTHSHSITSNSPNKRTQISSPMSVLDQALDQAHCVDGISTNFGNCLQAKKQELHEPIPKAISPHKHSKKGSISHSNPHMPKESTWAQQLLKACASAIASNNISRTQHLMWVLNDLASFTGDTNQRLAACGLKALFSRVTGTVSLPPSLEVALDSNSNLTAPLLHRALLKFQDVSPWHKCTYTIANGAIAEACEGHDIIHVVDIGVSQGTQWPTLIESLATRACGAPKLLKLTMVENGVGWDNFVSRLEPFAKRLGLNLRLRSIAKPLESLTSKDLELDVEEELIVCLQFRLHHLTQEVNEETPCTSSKRDKFLQFIHTLNPNTFILSENDIDHCSLDFINRFQKAMEFQWSFLNSTSSSFQGQESEERQIIEAQATLTFINIVAFESNLRTERNETHKAWSLRAQRAGFSSYLPGAQVLESAKSLLRKHSGDWNMLVEDGTMVLKWKANPTTFCSLWKPFSSPRICSL